LVSVILLVMGDDHLSFAVAEAVSLVFLKDYMMEDFEVVSHTMRIMFVILKYADRELHDFLMRAQMEPYFATSWLITWLSHDVKSLDELARIFDTLLCSHPMFSFYICAAVRLILFLSRFK
jgi:hypothetical protein